MKFRGQDLGPHQPPEATPRKPPPGLKPGERARIRAELEEALGEYLDKRKLSFIPTKYQIGYLNCLMGSASRAAAIKVHCHECMGWSHDTCDNRSCVLYNHSPQK